MMVKHARSRESIGSRWRFQNAGLQLRTSEADRSGVENQGLGLLVLKIIERG